MVFHWGLSDSKSSQVSRMLIRILTNQCCCLNVIPLLFELLLLLLLLFSLLRVFHTMIVFHWSLSDSESPHVFRTLLCILVDLNNAIVWIISSSLLISKSSNSCTSHLVTVPSTWLTIGITVTFMFRWFLVLFQGPCTFSFRFFSSKKPS